MHSHSALELPKHIADECAHLGPLGLGTPVTKGLWGRDFGVVKRATEALVAGFVRLYWPNQGSGRINRKADRGGYEKVRTVCDARPHHRGALSSMTIYCVTDRLHNRRTVQVPGHQIAPVVSAWLAELGAHSPLVEDLARAADVGEWAAAYAVGAQLSVDVTVAAAA
jgi:hypothetical protein